MAKTNTEAKTNRHEFTLKVEGENWTKQVSHAFEKVRKNVTVDGFRKGKVPKEIFDKKFGSQDYLVEAANHMISEEFTKIMKENNYDIVVEPQIEMKTLTEEVLECTMTLIENPEVTIKKYTGLNIKREKVQVTEEEIDHELAHLLEHFSEVVPKDEGAVEQGDIAIIDFEGFKDGVAFEGGKGLNHSLEIGSHSFIPGFEEQLIGMKKDEEREIEVTFPEDYYEENLKGAKATFKVKVHEIKARKVRELDKEFFDDLALEGVDSEESLRKEIKSTIETQKERSAENKYIDDLIDAVSKQAEVDIPEEMVANVTENMLAQMKDRLAMQGLNFDMYMKFSGRTLEEIKSEMEKEAFSRVLARLTLEKIQQLENITVTEEELEEKIKTMMEEHHVTEEEILSQVRGGREALKYDLEINKVIDFLKDANK